MDGVRSVVTRGLVDEKNLFVHGWSYGGYMTTWIVTQTHLFKAACAGLLSATFTQTMAVLILYGSMSMSMEESHGKPRSIFEQIAGQSRCERRNTHFAGSRRN